MGSSGSLEGIPRRDTTRTGNLAKGGTSSTRKRSGAGGSANRAGKGAGGGASSDDDDGDNSRLLLQETIGRVQGNPLQRHANRIAKSVISTLGQTAHNATNGANDLVKRIRDGLADFFYSNTADDFVDIKIKEKDGEFELLIKKNKT
jgi:hypothetical protein